MECMGVASGCGEQEMGSNRLSFTAADYHRYRHLRPTSNENANDKHLRVETTEGNSPLENNSIKGRCANCSESNAVARYSAELDAHCRPLGGS